MFDIFVPHKWLISSLQKQTAAMIVIPIKPAESHEFMGKPVWKQACHTLPFSFS